MWNNWNTGRQDWSLGRIVPDEMLYYLNGPAIFTCRIGLDNYLFYKSDEYDDGDYFIASPISDRELTAVKEGRLSIRGALSQSLCWLMQIDLDLAVVRYEQKSLGEIYDILPKPGVPLLSSFRTAPDSINQADSLFAFKFFGSDLSNNGMPLSIFKGLVDSVYDVVRNALTPPSLGAGRDNRFMDFSVRQPEFASLLIAIDQPVLDVTALRAKARTRELDPRRVLQEAYNCGRDFAERVERTIDLAQSNRLTYDYTKSNFLLVERLVDILPSTNSEISKMQFSSTSGGESVFVEVDSIAGDLIRSSFNSAKSQNIDVTGNVTGIIGRTASFHLRADFNREITCELRRDVFEELVANGQLRYGARVAVSGRYRRRSVRDLLKVSDMPRFLQ